MAEDCLTRLLDPKVKKALFGERDIPDATLNKWLEGVQEIKVAFDQGHINNLEFNKTLKTYIDTKRVANEVEQAVRIGDVVRKKARQNFYNQPAFKDKPVEAFHAALTKTDLLANGGRNSVHSMERARLVKYTDHIRDALMGSQSYELALSGQLDEEVAHVMHTLATNGEMPTNMNPHAIEIGKAFKEAQDLVFLDMQDAGIPVKYLKTRVALQTHSPLTVKAAGFDNWAAEVMALKPNKDFLGPKAQTPEGMRNILKGIYDEVVAGKYGSLGAITDGELVDTQAQGRISVNATKNRILHFDTPENQIKYNKMFGTKANLIQTIYSDVARKAKQISMFEKFGDLPRQNLISDIDKQIGLFEKQGNEKALNQLKGSRQRILAEFDQLAGTTSTPGNETIARIGRAIGALEATSKLGNVGLRSTANLAGTISEIKSTTGMNFLQSVGTVVSEWSKELPAGFNRTWFKEYADLIKTMNGEIAAQMDGGGVTGKMASMADFLMKVNGQEILNHTTSQAVATIHQIGWAREAGKDFLQIPTRMQAGLLQAGINANDFKLFKFAIEDAATGTKMVTPEAIGRKGVIPDDSLKEVMIANKFKGSAEAYRRGLEDKLRAFMIQSADIATTTAGPREASRLNAGLQSGTPEGEIIRLFGRFKSFTLQSFNIAKTFLNSNPDTDLLAKGILASKGKSYKLLAEWAVMGTALAYMSDSLLRMADGKELKDPTHPGVWLDSLAKSGSGGMYVDFFAGEWDKYDFSASLLGPTLGQISPAAKAVTKVGKGNISGATNDVTKMLRSYIPFQQAVGMKQVLDYAQYNLVNEALNPGASAKYQLKQMQQKYQK